MNPGANEVAARRATEVGVRGRELLASRAVQKRDGGEIVYRAGRLHRGRPSGTARCGSGGPGTTYPGKQMVGPPGLR